MTVFVGIDLAWSGARPSGICVLEDATGEARSVCLGAVTWPPETVFAWMETLGPDVLAAIDAPLLIGERRRAEAGMATGFPHTGLRAYSARWDFLGRHGITAGPELGALLDGSGWRLDPAGVALPGRRAVEVFPHAVIVSLFQSPRLLQYKKGPLAARRRALATFQGMLDTHSATCLAESARCSTRARIRTDAAGLRGRSLKGHEDELDAIACAFAALHFGRHGEEGMRVFGDATEGYIAVPVLAPA